MNWLYKLERKYGRFGIDHLMIYITATMLAVYLMNMMRLPISGLLYFDRGLIFSGQIWRILTFIFLPPSARILFIVLALYFFYFVGETLENRWGSFKFTVYYLFGVLGAIIGGLITGYAGNSYLNLSLFFAFAHLFPDLQVLVFFVVPVKVKWLGYINWAFFALSFITALVHFDWATCAMIVFSVINYFIFFGKDFGNRFTDWRKYGSNRRNFRGNNKNNPWGF